MWFTLPRYLSPYARRRSTIIASLDNIPFVIRSTSDDEGAEDKASDGELETDAEDVEQEEYAPDNGPTAITGLDGHDRGIPPTDGPGLENRQSLPTHDPGNTGVPLLNTMTTRISSPVLQPEASTATVTGTGSVAPIYTAAPAIPSADPVAPIAEENVVAPEPTTPATSQSPAGSTLPPATTNTAIPTLPNGLEGIPGLADLAADQVAAAPDAAQSQADSSSDGNRGSNSGAVVVAIGVIAGVAVALLMITCFILRCNRKEKEAKQKTVV